MCQADAVPGNGDGRLLWLELEDFEDTAAGTRIQPILHAGAVAPNSVAGSAGTLKNVRTRSDGVSATPTSGQPNTSQ
jgi:hypothetical protein